MKKIKKIWIVLIIVSLLVCSLLIIFLVRKSKWNVVLKDTDVSMLEEVYTQDFVDYVKNGKVVSNELVDTSSLGKHSVSVIVEDFFKRKHSYMFDVVVVDNEKPVISGVSEIETEEGKEVDLLKNIVVSDNSGEDVQVLVEGAYDFNKVGEYTIYYVAKDSSGNEVKEEALLKVKEKKKVVVPSENVSSSSSNVSKVSPSVSSLDKEFVTSKGFKAVIKNGVTYIDGVLVVNKSYSLPESYGNGLTAETKNAFTKMQSAATLSGLNIYLSSGYRSYATQKKLYNNYVNRDGKNKADTYSARPGNSEHQSGLAFDVNQINDTFNNSAEAVWLANNCYKYGFILRYPNGKTNETGYKYESWHFRYVGEDLATKLYNNGDWITLEDYFGITSVYE